MGWSVERVELLKSSGARAFCEPDRSGARWHHPQCRYRQVHRLVCPTAKSPSSAAPRPRKPRAPSHMMARLAARHARQYAAGADV